MTTPAEKHAADAELAVEKLEVVCERLGARNYHVPDQGGRALTVDPVYRLSYSLARMSYLLDRLEEVTR
jgi:hypothetical protein